VRGNRNLRRRDRIHYDPVQVTAGEDAMNAVERDVKCYRRAKDAWALMLAWFKDHGVA
jgi:hypothetical protein